MGHCLSNQQAKMQQRARTTMSQSGETRRERDSMGEFEVPADAYYGANTMRAVVNFPISDLRFPRSFIRALGLIKLAAAQVNHELDLLDGDTLPRDSRSRPGGRGRPP